MKPVWLFILCLCLAGIQAGAQKIRFTDTSNVWALVAFTSDPSSNPACARYTRDTTIGGVVYHRLVVYSSVRADTLAVREDTLNGKIYFRFLAPDYHAIHTDTLERILFDYNLSTGDTLRAVYTNYTVLHIVERLDSVQLGGLFYKHWVMRFNGYEFIEGVGTNQGPANIFYPGLVPVQFQLRCFWNQGIKASCKPAVHVPFGFYKPTYPWEPIPVDSFDNAISCSFKYVGVSSIERIVEPVFSPNPGGKEICLSLPDAIPSAGLQITDITGRNVLQKEISMHKTNIGQYLSVPGLYYYVLQDAATSRRFTGKFIFQ